MGPAQSCYDGRDGCLGFLYGPTLAEYVAKQCEPLRRQRSAIMRDIAKGEADMKRLRRDVEHHATGGDAYVARARAEQLVHVRRDFKRASEDLRCVNHFLTLYRAQSRGVASDRALVGLTRVMEVRAASMSPQIYAMLVQSHKALAKSLTRQGPAITFYDERPAEAELDERNAHTGIDEEVRGVFAELQLESLLPPPQHAPAAAALTPAARAVERAPALTTMDDDEPDDPPSPAGDVLAELTHRLAALRE